MAEFSLIIPTFNEDKHIEQTIKTIYSNLRNLKFNPEVIIVDDSKVVKALGIDFPLPVEVIKFGWTSTKKSLESFDCEVIRREIIQGEPFITDNGNYVLDCDFEYIHNPEQLEKDIKNIPGVVENGLFINLAHQVRCRL